MPRDAYDDYEAFRRAGSAGAYARAHGLDQLPWAQKMIEHPAYDAFWQGQALDKLVAQHPSQVPTMWIQGLWDQEDMWGAIHCYLALKAQGAGGPQLSGDGPVAAQPGELRRLQSGAAQVGRRHRPAVPPRRAEALLRSVSENGRAEGRHAARVHLQHRRESLGPSEELAAGLRAGLRRAAEAALSGSGLRLGIRQASRRRERLRIPTSPIPQSRCPICRGRCVSPTPIAGSSGW